MRLLSLSLLGFKKFLKYRHFSLSSYRITICICVPGFKLGINLCWVYGLYKKLYVMMLCVEFKSY